MLVLLLKFCALLALIEQQHTAVLLIAPLIGRSALLAVFLTTPYVRAGGLGQALADHLPRKAGWWVLVLSAVACVVLAGTAGMWALLLAALGFAWLRRVMMQRLGGTTGVVCSNCMVVCSETVSTVFSGVCMPASTKAFSTRYQPGLHRGPADADQGAPAHSQENRR